MKKEELTMDEIEALTKRFKDYIDKVQETFEKSVPKPDVVVASPPETGTGKKLYTILSPVDAMTRNLKSVLTAIDEAIRDMDGLTEGSGEATDSGKVRAVSPGQFREKFSEEELDYLGRTFQTVLTKSKERREKMLKNIDKKSPGDPV